MANWWYYGGWDGLFSTWMETAIPRELFVRELMFCSETTMASVLKPKECVDLLNKVLREPDFETRKVLMHQLAVLEVDTYCLYFMPLESSALFVKYPEFHDDGLYEVNRFIWTPATAWLDR